MQITAGELGVRVDYRIPGKQYNVYTRDARESFNEESRTTFPFDSQDLEPGQTFDATGLEVVRVVEYTPLPERPEINRR